MGEDLGDRESQTGTPVFTRRGSVRLLEILEQLADLLTRQADASVAHGKAQQDLVRIAVLDANHQIDFTVLGELNGVIGIVDEHLREPQRIAHQTVWNVLGNVEQ